MKSVEDCDKERLAEACGIHMGDGYVRSDEEGRNELDISGSEEEREYYDNHVVSLFSKLLDRDIEAQWFPNRSTYGFRVYGAEIATFFIEDLGFPNGKKESISAPDFIMSMENQEVVQRFLRGLYDTDGCLNFYRRHGYGSEFQQTYHYYPRISLTNTSKILVGQIEDLLKWLDIGFFITSRSRENHENWADCYKIMSVGKIRLKKFMKRIGFKNPVKFTRYHVWKRYSFCPTNTSLQERYKMICGETDPRSYYKGP